VSCPCGLLGPLRGVGLAILPKRLRIGAATENEYFGLSLETDLPLGRLSGGRGRGDCFADFSRGEPPAGPVGLAPLTCTYECDRSGGWFAWACLGVPQ
jgi:hypothetical protein